MEFGLWQARVTGMRTLDPELLAARRALMLAAM
jgi:hypothetical protein